METKKKVSKKTTPVKIKTFKDLEGKFLLVKVGSSEVPATDIQIKDVQEKLIELLETNNINCAAFVTHHAVNMEIVEKQNNNE